MSTVFPSHKSCGSCMFWVGSRKVDYAHNIIVEGNSSGLCCNNKSGRYNSRENKALSSGCSSYVRWDV